MIKNGMEKDMMKMVIIIYELINGNGKVKEYDEEKMKRLREEEEKEKNMEKEYYIIKMVILNMKVILLMINMKEMENIFMKMVNII